MFRKCFILLLIVFSDSRDYFIDYKSIILKNYFMNIFCFEDV